MLGIDAAAKLKAAISASLLIQNIERRMPMPGVVEPLNLVKDICTSLVSGFVPEANTLSIFSLKKKLSIAALSQHTSCRLMLQVMP